MASLMDVVLIDSCLIINKVSQTQLIATLIRFDIKPTLRIFVYLGIKYRMNYANQMKWPNRVLS